MDQEKKVKMSHLINESDLEAYFDFEGVIQHLRQLVLDDPMVQQYVYQEVRDKGHKVSEYPELVDNEIMVNELALIKHQVEEETYWRAVTKTYRSLLLVVIGEFEA